MITAANMGAMAKMAIVPDWQSGDQEFESP